MKQQKEFLRPQLTGLQSRQEPKPAEVYYIDLAKHQNLVKVYSECFEYFLQIAQGYPALEIGGFTAEVLLKISKNDFSEIEKAFNENLAKSIKGIPNPVVRDNMAKNARMPYARFKMQTELSLLQIARIKRANPSIDFDPAIYSIKAGVISFDAESRGKLKEKYCTIYLDSPAKKQFAELAETTLSSLQSLKDLMIKNDIPDIFGAEGLFQDCGDDVSLDKRILACIKE
jgi:hypothetical protein